jgi:hypothetical protein
VNTPAHILICAAAFSHRRDPSDTRVAGLGGLLPDLSLYAMAGGALFLMDIPARVVFGQLYFSSSWQTVFSIDNSFLLWGLVGVIALWSDTRWLTVLAGACLLHLALDFPLHHDDGRAHFWPATSWVFESPVSYWDSRHHAGIVAPVEGALAVGAAAVLALRHGSWPARTGIGLLVAMELYVIQNWLWFF